MRKFTIILSGEEKMKCRFCQLDMTEEDLTKAKKLGHCHLECYHKSQREHMKKWYYDHRELAIKRTMESRAKYKDRRNATDKKRRLEIKIEVLSFYSNGIPECRKCGFKDIRALSIDHIKGKTEKERKNRLAGWKFYFWLKTHEYPEGYQTLCMNCQYIKREEENENAGWNYRK